uniref:Uncharacterized protein n=1 Tax=Glossina palpalis gambiensis TaxID=67801 RepID=A0A1B0AT74_9MUSC
MDTLHWILIYRGKQNFTVFIFRWLRWTPFFAKNTTQKVEKLMTFSVSHKFCLNYSDLVINAIAAFTQFVNLSCQSVNRGFLFSIFSQLCRRCTSYNWRERYLSKRRTIFLLKRGTIVFGSRPKKNVSSGSSSTSSPFSSGASNLSSLSIPDNDIRPLNHMRSVPALLNSFCNSNILVSKSYTEILPSSPKVTRRGKIELT